MWVVVFVWLFRVGRGVWVLGLYRDFGIGVVNMLFKWGLCFWGVVGVVVECEVFGKVEFLVFFFLFICV